MLKFHLVSDLPLKLHVYKVRGVVARAVDAENHDCHDAEIEQQKAQRDRLAVKHCADICIEMSFLDNAGDQYDYRTDKQDYVIRRNKSELADF